MASRDGQTTLRRKAAAAIGWAGPAGIIGRDGKRDRLAEQQAAGPAGLRRSTWMATPPPSEPPTMSTSSRPRASRTAMTSPAMPS